MQVLCLADRKSPAMDKLFYYVLQTDQMLSKYVSDVEEIARGLLSAPTLEVMGRELGSAGLSDDLRSDDGEDGDDSIIDGNNGDDSTSSAKSDD